MCGLMGGSGKLNVEVVRSLACQNVTRGKDSAGLAWVEKGEHVIEKVAQHPLVAFNVTLARAVKTATESGIMIGHTRAATTGSITNSNAHPFLKGGIAFAHNGIILNHKKFGKYAVDSESLIHGIKKRDFSKYIGPIALMWLENGLLHAYRRGNPLHRGVKDGGLYLASEAVFLQRVGCKLIKELIEGVIYTFKDAKVKATLTVPKNQVWEYSAPHVTHSEEPFVWNSGKRAERWVTQEADPDDVSDEDMIRNLGLNTAEEAIDRIRQLNDNDEKE